MAILSDEAILSAIDVGELNIVPFNKNNLTPNGYDLTIDEVEIPNESKTLEGSLVIPAGKRFAVSTKERIECGSNVCAQLWLRTSWARKGIMCSFGKIDSGFNGTLTLLGFNSGNEEVELKIGETFAQMVFEMMSGPAASQYSERSGNYQNQKGITWSK
jgi:dCTP deaminase|tara:strand:- start:10274 stop:10750 length:477 start_codon:yes stop_codon:yes gene_type:complete